MEKLSFDCFTVRGNEVFSGIGLPIFKKAGYWTLFGLPVLDGPTKNIPLACPNKGWAIYQKKSGISYWCGFDIPGSPPSPDGETCKLCGEKALPWVDTPLPQGQIRIHPPGGKIPHFHLQKVEVKENIIFPVEDGGGDGVLLRLEVFSNLPRDCGFPILQGTGTILAQRTEGSDRRSNCIEALAILMPGQYLHAKGIKGGIQRLAFLTPGTPRFLLYIKGGDELMPLFKREYFSEPWIVATAPHS